MNHGKKVTKVSALSVSQDKVGYNAGTESRKSQWLNITEVYCLLMIRVPACWDFLLTVT